MYIVLIDTLICLALSTARFETPQYSAPEQACAPQLNFKVDVWAFGMMLMEAVVCKPSSDDAAAGSASAGAGPSTSSASNHAMPGLWVADDGEQFAPSQVTARKKKFITDCKRDAGSAEHHLQARLLYVPTTYSCERYFTI